MNKKFIVTLMLLVAVMTCIVPKSSASGKSLKLKFPYYSYTEDDVMVLGDAMWLENGHTGGVGTADNRKVLILTAAVILNRMVSNDKYVHRYGEKTIRDVIMAKGQYAARTRNNIGSTNTPDEVYELAEEILMYGTTVPDYVVFQGQNPRLGTLWCPAICGEYFATEKGHSEYYMEGKGWEIDTNKQAYIEQSFSEFQDVMMKLMNKSLKTSLKRIKSIHVMYLLKPGKGQPYG